MSEEWKCCEEEPPEIGVELNLREKSNKELVPMVLYLCGDGTYVMQLNGLTFELQEFRANFEWKYVEQL